MNLFLTQFFILSSVNSLKDCIEFPDSEVTKDFIAFLNNKMSDLVNEFVIEDYFDKSRRNIDARSLNKAENEIVSEVVNSFAEVIRTIENQNLSSVAIQNIFSKIFEGIKNLLPEFEKSTPAQTSETGNESGGYTYEELGYNDGLSYFAEWPNVCHMIWYPYHKEKCGEARCLACAPAMMASAQVCRQTEGRVTSDCIKQTLKGGFCNFCIRKYVQN